MDIYEDSRLISLNSKDARKLNGDYNSSCFFDIPNIVIDPEEDVEYILAQVEDFELPISYYLINDTNDTLHYRYNSIDTSITITQGNYNATTLITELQQKFSDNNLTATIILSNVTGKLDFRFSAPITDITFFYNLSRNLMTILGFNATITGVSFIAPVPLNLLGIMKVNICSNALATINNRTSSPNLSNNLIQTIAVNTTSWRQLTYINKTSHAGRLKSKTLDNGIDIQLFDDDGNFLELNSIDWSLTIQLKVFRKYRTRIDKINMEQFAQPKQEEKKQPNVLEKKQKDEGTGDEDLDLLLSK
jgi:hypothetical protein